MSDRKGVGGAPTKYKPEYCQGILDFFNREPFEPIIVKDSEGNEMPAMGKNGSPIFKPCKLPTLEGYAISLGVHKSTLWIWEKDHPEFFDAKKRAKDMQKEILVQNGLIGAYDRTFAIFTAKNVTDMTDKQEVTQNTNVTFGASLAERLSGGSKE